MIQQIQMTQVMCNHKDHQDQQVTSLCIRPQCQVNSVCCHKCQLQFHRNCADQITFFDQIPQIASTIQNLEVVYKELAISIEQVLKKIKKTLDALMKPIKEYQEIPNLDNLNTFGKLLRMNSTDQITQSILKSQSIISNDLIKLLKSLMYFMDELNQPSQNHKIKADKLFIESKQLIQVDSQKALACIEEAIKLVPKNQEYWCLQGLCLININRKQEGIQSCDMSIEIQPNVNAYCFKATSLNSLKLRDQAISCYEEGLKQFPNEEQLKLQLIYCKQKRINH